MTLLATPVLTADDARLIFSEGLGLFRHALACKHKIRRKIRPSGLSWRNNPVAGIMALIPLTELSSHLRSAAYPPVANARRGHRPDDVVAIDLRGPRNDHRHLLVPLGRTGTDGPRRSQVRVVSVSAGGGRCVRPRHRSLYRSLHSCNNSLPSI